MTFRIAPPCLIVLAALGAARAEERGIAARVNGVAISAERLERYQEEVVGGRDFLSMSNPASFKRHKREALEQLIDQELLWQEAQRRGALAPQAEVEAALGQLRARFASEAELARRLERAGFTTSTYREYLLRLLSIDRLVERDVAPHLAVTDEEVHDYYSADPERFAIPEEVHLRQILVRADASASADARARAKARAERLLARARRGDDFAALASQHSDDPSAPSGGDLGFVMRGQISAPLEASAFALAAGELSPLVESAQGFHLLKCEGKRGGGRRSELEASPAIRRKLLDEKLRKAVGERVAALRAQARIEIALAL
jgi:parvulin-like peptidyl-prolyl isomerase